MAQEDQPGALRQPREWDREGGREMQKGRDLGIYVYV